jgi:hypothetical protein
LQLGVDWDLPEAEAVADLVAVPVLAKQEDR